MPYQFVREPLRGEEADQLCQACGTMLEKLIIWILIDIGLRVSELCSLTSQDILWQQKSLRISGKVAHMVKNLKNAWFPCQIESVRSLSITMPSMKIFLLAQGRFKK